jgi:hypothetical protein
MQIEAKRADARSVIFADVAVDITRRYLLSIVSCDSNLLPRAIAVAAVLFESVHATQKLYAGFHRIVERTHSRS